MVLCRLADDQLAGGIDADDAGHRKLAIHRNDRELAVLGDGDRGVGGPEIDTDDEWREVLVHE